MGSVFTAVSIWPDRCLVSNMDAMAPRSDIPILLGLFGLTLFIFAMTYKWLGPLVDAYVERSGRLLR